MLQDSLSIGFERRFKNISNLNNDYSYHDVVSHENLLVYNDRNSTGFVRPRHARDEWMPEKFSQNNPVYVSVFVRYQLTTLAKYNLNKMFPKHTSL